MAINIGRRNQQLPEDKVYDLARDFARRAIVHKDITSVALGGSWAKGVWAPGSDLDVVIVVKNKKSALSHIKKVANEMIQEHSGQFPFMDIKLRSEKEINKFANHPNLSSFWRIRTRIVKPFTMGVFNVIRKKAGVAENEPVINSSIIDKLLVKYDKMFLEEPVHPVNVIQSTEILEDKDDFFKKKQKEQVNRLPPTLRLLFSRNGIQKVINAYMEGRISYTTMVNLAKHPFSVYWSRYLTRTIKKTPPSPKKAKEVKLLLVELSKMGY